MARYLINCMIADLNALGVTTAEIEARIGANIYIDGDDVFAYGRKGQSRVSDLLHEARERAARDHRNQALRSGRLVEWRNVSGAWLLAGQTIQTGDIVTVTRRDGTTSEEIVGQIVGELNGLTLAHVGQI